MDKLPILRLTLLGGPTLAGADGTPLSGRAAQRHRLALLALLARSPGMSASRDVLMARLWPESDTEQARNLLKVSVYVLRQALGDDAVVSAGDLLRLNPDVVEVDTREFDAAVERGDPARAIEWYGGWFMEGFFLRASPEFEHWLDAERAVLAGSYAKALEALAERAQSLGDLPGAAEWWKARAAHDPYDSRVALRLMEAMAAAGSRAGALRHAAIHAKLLGDELDIEPSADVRTFTERLRRDSHPSGLTEVASIPPPSTTTDPAGAAGVDPPRSRMSVAPVAFPVMAAAAAVAIVVTWTGRDPAGRTATPEEIARAVIREIGGVEAGVAAAVPPTSNVAAWELYRRAAQPEVLRSDSAARDALGLARKAVELDPSFAGAHAVLARLFIRGGPPEEPDLSRASRLRLAEAHASTAIELDVSLAEAHGTLGLARMSLLEFDAAEEHLRRSIELEPSWSRAREWLVHLYIWMGRFADALREAELAARADPVSASARGELARALLVNGRCADALDVLESLMELQPSLLRAAPIAAQCHAQTGDWDQAIEDIRRDLPRSGDIGRAYLAYFLALAGYTDEASRELDTLLHRHAATGEGSFLVATVYAGLGDRDRAFAWLERAVDDYSVTYEIREPRFAELHADPRFSSFLARLRLR